MTNNPIDKIQELRKAVTCLYFEVDESIANDIRRASEAVINCLEQEPKVCILPPKGWTCSRKPGHEGPCAARPCPVLQQPAQPDRASAIEEPVAFLFSKGEIHYYRADTEMALHYEKEGFTCQPLYLSPVQPKGAT